MFPTAHTYLKLSLSISTTVFITLFTYFSFGQNVFFNLNKEYFVAGEAKNNAIICAKYTAKSMYFAELLYFGGKNVQSSSFADSALINTRIALEFAQKSIDISNDTCLTAKLFMGKSIKKLTQAKAIILKNTNSENLSQNKKTWDQVIFFLGDATIDAYTASLYFFGELPNDSIKLDEDSANTLAQLSPCPECPPCDETKEEFQATNSPNLEPVDNFTTEDLKKIKRLEVDESSFTQITLIYEKRIATMQETIDRLNAELASTTGSQERAILEEKIENAKQEETVLRDKNIGSEKKLQIIREELDELRNKKLGGNPDGGKPIFVTDKSGFYNDQNPIPLDEPLPDGLIYSIQLGVYHKHAVPEWFNGLYPLAGQTISGGMFKYRTGLFYTYKQAVDAKNKIHEMNLKDSFIVAFNNGQTISVSNAIKLE